MANINDMHRGIDDRANRERGVSGRATAKRSGNPGTYLGTENHWGFIYARYRAEKGTWVSSSLAALGYDKVYRNDVAFGAYLGVAQTPEGEPLKNPDRLKPGQEYLIPIGTAVEFKDFKHPSSVRYLPPQIKLELGTVEGKMVVALSQGPISRNGQYALSVV